MAYTLKLTAIGNSTGIVIPKELLEKLRLSRGDVVHVLDVPGGLEMKVYDDKFAAQMDVAERIMREDRDILHKLAQ